MQPEKIKNYFKNSRPVLISFYQYSESDLGYNALNGSFGTDLHSESYGI